MARPRGILGRACGSLGIENLDRAPPVEFCNQNNPQAQPRDRPIPGAFVRRDASSLRWTWRNLRKGLRPLPPHRSSAPGDTRHPRRCSPFGLRAMMLSGASRGFTSQRPAGSRRPTPRAACPKARDGAFPRLDPLGHLSSRDHGGTGRNPGPGATGRKPSGATPVTSPRRPFLTSKRKDAGRRGLCTVCFRETGDPSRPNADCLHSLRASARAGALDCSHSPTPPGPRAASPEPPRRSPRSAAPEVPSIGKLPSGQARAFTRAIHSGRALSTSCCQAVDNARRRFQASPYPDSLDVPRAKKPASPLPRNRAEAQHQ